MAIEIWRPRRGLGRSLSPAADLRRQMDDMFDRFFGDFPTLSATQMRGWSPALDVIDRKDEVVVRADLPGLGQKDVQVEVQDGTLSLKGERSEEHEEKEEDYYCAERWEGKFERTITLPSGVDTDKIDASFRNGVLEVHLPKTKEARGRKIEVKES